MSDLKNNSEIFNLTPYSLDQDMTNSIESTLSKCNYYDNLSNLTFLNSIPKNFDSITDYLFFLRKDFSIIVITESWLNNNNKTIFNIPNFSSEHITRNNKRGGGVSYLYMKISHIIYIHHYHL